MTDIDNLTGIPRIDAECAALVRGERESFAAAREMWGEAMDSMVEGGDPALQGHWLLWGNLTDDPDRTDRDSERINRAASEWLSVAEAGHKTDDVTTFFDRWLYEELGLKPS